MSSEHDLIQQAREAATEGYNSTPPEATHGDGLDAAVNAALRTLLNGLKDESAPDETLCREVLKAGADAADRTPSIDADSHAGFGEVGAVFSCVELLGALRSEAEQTGGLTAERISEILASFQAEKTVWLT